MAACEQASAAPSDAADVSDDAHDDASALRRLLRALIADGCTPMSDATVGEQLRVVCAAEGAFELFKLVRICS